MYSPILKPNLEASDQNTSKFDTPQIKLEEQRVALSKQSEYVELLKLENQKLKEELRIEKQKSKYMEKQIEIENKPLDYNFSKLLMTKTSHLATQASKESLNTCTMSLSILRGIRPS
jgi:hypothetical protein